MKFLTKRAVGYSLIILLALLSALPNILPDSVLETLPAWYADNQVNLGLDLRGGAYLLLEVDEQDLMIDHNQQFAETVADALREAGIRHGKPQVTADSITLSLGESTPLSLLNDITRDLVIGNTGAGAIRAYDIDIDSDRLQLQATRLYKQSLVTDAVEQSLEVVRRRLDESGLIEPSITAQGENGIEVQLPGVMESGRIRDLLGTTAKISFHWEAARDSAEVITLPGTVANQRYTLEREEAMAGRHVADARLGYNPDTGQPVVTFRLDNTGGRIFGEITGANVGRVLAVVLDESVITAPVIREPILGGSGEISGNFNSNDAADLAVMLRAGALPAELNVIEERTVGPNLGSDAIHLGIISGIAGGLLVLAFMVVTYGAWGLLAWAGLSVNVGLIFSILTLLQATLTLPGIAGIILGIGMAVDANILINERIREETRRGGSARQALETGFSKAWGTILDSNVTTLIAVSLLFTIGSGPVQGFAVTMGIGLLTSMFTALSVTRLLMEWFVRKLGRRPLEIKGLGVIDRLSQRYTGGNREINFMRAGVIGLIVSALLSLASVGLMVEPGLNYGIDFSGGALLEVQTRSTDIEQLRDAVRDSDFPEISIQEFGSSGDFQLRLPMAETENAGNAPVIDQIREVVLSVAPDADFPRAELVGPRVSGDFADLSILAILTGGLGMLCYLWMRFENHFALAAILTIALDLTKTIGFFALSGVEFNLTAIAALLALIGYSINDKVVVFDRIRENLQQQPDAPLASVLNASITATLTRTLLTSGSTFLALLPMAVYGGTAVASFALPMLFGVVIGTSSSIFIAAPILLHLGKRRDRLGLPQLSKKEVPDAELLRP